VKTVAYFIWKTHIWSRARISIDYEAESFKNIYDNKEYPEVEIEKYSKKEILI
jgi:hypothetical protein